MEAPTRDLWLYDVTSGTTTQVTFDSGATSPAWTRDAKRVAFSSTRVGVLNLFTAIIGEQQIVPSDSLPARTSSFQGRGLRMAHWCSRSNVRRQVGTFCSSLPAIARHGRWSGLPADETSPKISPDGRWLAYVSNEGGRSEVFVTPLSTPRGLGVSPSDGGSEPAWAPVDASSFTARALR